MHGTIEVFRCDVTPTKFTIIFSYLNLKDGGCLYLCTLEFTDWLGFKFYLPDKNVYLEGYKINEFYAEHKMDFDIYDIIDNKGSIIIDGYGDDDKFSLTILKPKIKITGDYDPD